MADLIEAFVYSLYGRVSTSGELKLFEQKQ